MGLLEFVLLIALIGGYDYINENGTEYRCATTDLTHENIDWKEVDCKGLFKQ